MQIGGTNALLANLFPNQSQQPQAAAAQREATETASAEAKESAKTQIAEGEAVQPTSATSSAAPGRLSIYV